MSCERLDEFHENRLKPYLVVQYLIGHKNEADHGKV